VENVEAGLQMKSGCWGVIISTSDAAALVFFHVEDFVPVGASWGGSVMV